MINEGEPGEGGEGELGGLAGPGDGAEGLDAPGVIQVSPQDKEAIERVGHYLFTLLAIKSIVASFSVESSWVPGESGSSGLLCL